MVGHKLDQTLRLAIGSAAVIVPPILVGAGVPIFLDSPLRRLRPLRLGGGLLPGYARARTVDHRHADRPVATEG